MSEFSPNGLLDHERVYLGSTTTILQSSDSNAVMPQSLGRYPDRRENDISANSTHVEVIIDEC